jgi:hypothetical protein
MTALLRDAKREARGVRGFEHSASVGDAVRDRLLTRDVLAGGEGREHMVRVHRSGAEDLHRVDVVVAEQILERAVQAIDRPLLPAALEDLASWVAQRDDLALLVRQIPRDVQGCDVADSHDSDAHRCHDA